MSKLAATLLSGWLLVLPSASGLTRSESFPTQNECKGRMAVALTEYHRKPTNSWMYVDGQAQAQIVIADKAEMRRARCIPDGAAKPLE